MYSATTILSKLRWCDKPIFMVIVVESSENNVSHEIDM